MFVMCALALRGALARSSESTDSSHVRNASYEAAFASPRLGERPVPEEPERCSATADGLQLQQGPCGPFDGREGGHGHKKRDMNCQIHALT